MMPAGSVENSAMKPPLGSQDSSASTRIGSFLTSLIPKKHFMAFLLCALILPPLSVVLLSVSSMVSQERAMEAAVSSYVRDMAESIAYRISGESEIRLSPFQHDWGKYGSSSESIPRSGFLSVPRSGAVRRFSGVMPYPFFSWGPSIPGWVAVINSAGKVIMASPNANNIAAIWRSDLPIGRAVRVSDKRGAQYTLAICPISDGEGFVVAAVSWSELMGGLVTVGRMWPALILLTALCSFLAIRLLWNRIVTPLQSITSEIDNLRVGKDIPQTIDYGGVREIECVHGALTRFAKAAVERDILRNSYVRDIVRVQENERTDMARELHDGPLQDVTALLQQIHMSLDEASEFRARFADSQSNAQEDDGFISHAKRAEGIARSVVRELRSMCDELSPPWMDLGLSETLTELAERLSQNYDVTVNIDIDGSAERAEEMINNSRSNGDKSGAQQCRFNDMREVSVTFLRILQESVSNAVRHGGASEVNAAVREDGGSLLLEVSDNGSGFNANIDHESLRLQGHRGLANMTERMSLMGGSLSIESKQGTGTHVCARLPIAVK